MYVKRNSFKKYLNIFIEKLIMGIKEYREYKVNFWGILIADFSLVVIYTIFYFVYSSLLSDFLNWTQINFITYLLAILLTLKIVIYTGIRKFTKYLILGKINENLVRPVNVYFMESLRTFSSGGIVTTIIVWIFYSLIVIFNYNFINILISIPVFLFGLIYQHLFESILESISFFMKKNFLIDLVNKKINYTNEKYTPKSFEGSFLKNFFFILPSAVYGYFLVEILRGNFTEFLFYLPYFLFISISLLFGIYFLWKFCLKKYEAFG